MIEDANIRGLCEKTLLRPRIFEMFLKRMQRRDVLSDPYCQDAPSQWQRLYHQLQRFEKVCFGMGTC